MIKVGIYARFSTEIQSHGKSIESQVFRCTKFIEEHKDWTLAKIYKDEAKSGRYVNRKEFQQIVRDVADGIISIVVIDAITRASRFEDLFDYYNWKHQITANGGQVYSATEDIHNDEIGDIIEFMSLWQSKR